MSRAAAIDAVMRLAVSRRGRTTFVGVDGPGGAGKSTLAAQLCAVVPGAVVVAVDDFSGPQIAEWDWPRLREQVLLPLVAGRSARYQHWDWDRDAGAEWHDVTPGHVVIIEGVSSTREEVGAPWGLTIWVDTPREVRLARAIERDGEAMLPQWSDVWMPSERAYIATQSPQARVDLVVRGVADAVQVRPCAPPEVDLLERAMPANAAGVYAAHLADQQAGTGVYLVAWNGDRPLGSAVLDWRGYGATNSRRAYPGIPVLCYLQVRPDARGRGVGTALVATAEDVARTRGAAATSMGVGVDNPDAARLYLRLGYRRTGVFDESGYPWTDRAGARHDEVEFDELLVKRL